MALHLMEVEDELGQVLNGVDVVMGRRRDEGHARLAAPEVSNVGGHLLARQLAALTCSFCNQTMISNPTDLHREACLKKMAGLGCRSQLKGQFETSLYMILLHIQPMERPSDHMSPAKPTKVGYQINVSPDGLTTKPLTSRGS